MEWQMIIIFLVATLAASWANAACYAWAWNYRRVSAWQATPEGVGKRGWLDRIPIYGWLRLRRDVKQLGKGFWIRPMVVELLFGIAMVWLYHWEVVSMQLIGLDARLASNASPEMLAYGFYGFSLHAILAWLMLVATLIDIDEKTIPDMITVPGTLLGLVLVTIFPNGLLPEITYNNVEPLMSTPMTFGDQQVKDQEFGLAWLRSVHITAPNSWPSLLEGGSRPALLIGLACFWFWCFALTPRRLHTRRGVLFGLAIVTRRVSRTMRSTPLREILLAGTLLIAMVWFGGGDAWRGLLSGLVGMIISGGIVWSVRIIASLALGKEAMGFGDVTLMMMVGAFIGWHPGLLIFFFAPFAGVVIGILQLVLRHDDVIPYGPFLCLATCFVVIRWHDLWGYIAPFFSYGTLVPIVMIVCLLTMGVLLGLIRLFKARVLGISDS